MIGTARLIVSPVPKVNIRVLELESVEYRAGVVEDVFRVAQSEHDRELGAVAREGPVVVGDSRQWRGGVKRGSNDESPDEVGLDQRLIRP